MASVFQSRHDYHQFLEPTGTILHGAGQDPRGFDAYSRTLGDSRHPAVVMFYVSARAKKMLEWGEKIRLFLQEEARPPLLPQIGLSMTHDGKPEEHYEQEVAAGLHDESLDQLAEVIKSWKCPVFLRIGYEFNGSWNGYQATSFVPAYRHVVNRLRAAGANFASVWCAAKEGDPDILPYYPGDEFVDWWSIDLFSREHLETDDPFYELAHQHGKPVMIGESTPRFVGTLEGEKSWQQWFAPYFAVMQEQPGIKAFCYINWEWSEFPQWHDWGDGRIQMNPLVREKYQQMMADPIFAHADHHEVHRLIHTDPHPNAHPE